MTNLQPIIKLTKDLKDASKILSRKEARYIVDTYYQIQEFRKATANQIREMERTDEPTELISWIFDNLKTLENQLKNALDNYSKADPVGAWLQSIMGIGPVISAGLLAHIDIEKAPTAGHIWSFAGLDPNSEWLGRERSNKLFNEVVGNEKVITEEHISTLAQRAGINNMERFYALRNDKGKYAKKDVIMELSKRPWNAKLKTLCWKIGQSFVKVSNNEKDIYGKLYQQRKTLETAQNELLMYKSQAESILVSKNIGKDTEAYKWYSKGMLPPAHIQQRAERYAVKIFLSHLQAVWYKEHYGVEPPKPFAIAVLGHAHEIPVPINTR